MADAEYVKDRENICWKTGADEGSRPMVHAESQESGWPETLAGAEAVNERDLWVA